MAGLKRTDNKGRILKDGESQRKDGTYRYRYVDADNIRRDVYSNRLVSTDRTPKGYKADICLRDKEKKINRDIEDGIKARVENKATVNDIFNIYMDTKINLKDSTRENYIYMYDKYVRNDFGKKKITSVSYSDIKTFYNSLIVEKGFKPNSMETINTLLHPLFSLAVRDNYIRTNPTDGVMAEMKKSNNWVTPKRRALTITEQEAFVSYISSSQMYSHWSPLFTVFLGTGCRIGEIIGLRWEDCDFENLNININHNLIYRKSLTTGCMEFHITTPKTEKGVRDIPMMKEVKAALQAEYNRQVEMGFNKSEIDGYTGFIFTNRNGGVFRPPEINRAIERIRQAYNTYETELAKKEDREPALVDKFSAHNLRHTFCTRFCENETNLKAIQEIMGHAQIETTMDIYAEATQEKKRESIANLEGKVRIS